MQLTNLTPHTITLFTHNGIKEIPASGQLARVRNEFITIGELEGLAVVRQQFGEVTGLPDPQPDTTYIVSTIVLNALSSNGIVRDDVVAPGTGPSNGAIRDPEGRIRGVTQLVKQ